jgi:hypothetical protein
MFGIRGLRKDLDKANRKIKDLELKVERLHFLIKNPPKFKKGDKIGKITVIEVTLSYFENCYFRGHCWWVRYFHEKDAHVYEIKEDNFVKYLQQIKKKI